MQAKSASEVYSEEDDVIQIAFDLRGSIAEYLIISIPKTPSAAEGFFEQDHYVELKDQLFGRYGGLSALMIVDDNRFEIRLSYEVPGIDMALSVSTNSAIDEPILSQLRFLERS